MSAFELSQLEKENINELKVRAFSYNAMKVSANQMLHPCILNDLRQFLPKAQGNRSYRTSYYLLFGITG